MPPVSWSSVGDQTAMLTASSDRNVATLTAMAPGTSQVHATVGELAADVTVEVGGAP